MTGQGKPLAAVQSPLKGRCRGNRYRFATLSCTEARLQREPVLLLPGSRKQAVARIFPALLAGFRSLGERDAVVLYPSREIREVLQAASPDRNVRLVETAETVASGGPIGAAAVLTSSGTMSMHCALAGIPGAIAYRAAPLTYLLGRMLVKVPYLGIANLLLREPMYPEYIQNAATPGALAGELKACLHDRERQLRTSQQAARLRSLLHAPVNGSAATWVAAQLR